MNESFEYPNPNYSTQLLLDGNKELWKKFIPYIKVGNQELFLVWYELLFEEFDSNKYWGLFSDDFV